MSFVIHERKRNNMFAMLSNFGKEQINAALSPAARHVSSSLGISESTARLGLGLAGVSAAGALLWRCYGGNVHNLPPGPNPLPVIGNIHNMGKNPRGYLIFDNLKNKYGDIYTVYIGTRRMVVLNTPELVREAFMRQSLATANRPSLALLDALSADGQDIVAAHVYSPRLQIQRKLAHSALRKFTIDEAYGNYLQNAFDIMAQQLDENPEFNGFEMALSLTYNIISSAAFGKMIAKDDPFLLNMIALTKQFDEGVEDFGLTDFIPILRYLPYKALTLGKDFLKEINKYVVAAIEEHEEAFDPDNLTDFTYHLFNARKEAQEDVKEHSKLKLLSKTHYIMILNDLFIVDSFGLIQLRHNVGRVVG